MEKYTAAPPAGPDGNLAGEEAAGAPVQDAEAGQGSWKLCSFGILLYRLDSGWSILFLKLVEPV